MKSLRTTKNAYAFVKKLQYRIHACRSSNNQSQMYATFSDEDNYMGCSCS